MGGRASEGWRLPSCSLRLHPAPPPCPSAAREAAALEAAQNAYQPDKPIRLLRSFPLAAVVGMDHIKQALLLGAVRLGPAGLACGCQRCCYL